MLGLVSQEARARQAAELLVKMSVDDPGEELGPGEADDDDGDEAAEKTDRGYITTGHSAPSPSNTGAEPPRVLPYDVVVTGDGPIAANLRGRLIGGQAIHPDAAVMTSAVRPGQGVA